MPGLGRLSGADKGDHTSPLVVQNFRPLIHVTRTDFDAITHDRALCDADGAIDAAGFEIMMREQVRVFRCAKRCSFGLAQRGVRLLDSEGRCTDGRPASFLLASFSLVIDRPRRSTAAASDCHSGSC